MVFTKKKVSKKKSTINIVFTKKKKIMKNKSRKRGGTRIGNYFNSKPTFLQSCKKSIMRNISNIIIPGMTHSGAFIGDIIISKYIRAIDFLEYKDVDVPTPEDQEKIIKTQKALAAMAIGASTGLLAGEITDDMLSKVINPETDSASPAAVDASAAGDDAMDETGEVIDETGEATDASATDASAEESTTESGSNSNQESFFDNTTNGIENGIENVADGIENVADGIENVADGIENVADGTMEITNTYKSIAREAGTKLESVSDKILNTEIVGEATTSTLSQLGVAGPAALTALSGGVIASTLAPVLITTLPLTLVAAAVIYPYKKIYGNDPPGAGISKENIAYHLLVINGIGLIVGPLGLSIGLASQTVSKLLFSDGYGSFRTFALKWSQYLQNVTRGLYNEKKLTETQHFRLVFLIISFLNAIKHSHKDATAYFFAAENGETDGIFNFMINHIVTKEKVKKSMLIVCKEILNGKEAFDKKNEELTINDAKYKKKYKYILKNRDDMIETVKDIRNAILRPSACYPSSERVTKKKVKKTVKKI